MADSNSNNDKKRRGERGWALLGLVAAWVIFGFTSPLERHRLGEYGLEEFRLVKWLIVGVLIGTTIGLIRDRRLWTTRPQFGLRHLLAYAYIASNLMFWWHFFYGDW